MSRNVTYDDKEENQISEEPQIWDLIALISANSVYFTTEPQNPDLISDKFLSHHYEATYGLIRQLLSSGTTFSQLLSNLALQSTSPQYADLFTALMNWEEERRIDPVEVVTAALREKYYRFISAPICDPQTLSAFVKEKPEPFSSLNQQLSQLLSTDNLTSQYQQAINNAADDEFTHFLRHHPSITQFLRNNLSIIGTLSDDFQQFEYSLKTPQVKELLGGKHFAFLCSLFKQDLAPESENNGESKTDDLTMKEKEALETLADISLLYPAEYEALKILFSKSTPLSSKKEEFFQYLDTHPDLAHYLYDCDLFELAFNFSQHYGHGPNIRLFQTKPKPPPSNRDPQQPSQEFAP